MTDSRRIPVAPSTALDEAKVSNPCSFPVGDAVGGNRNNDQNGNSNSNSNSKSNDDEDEDEDDKDKDKDKDNDDDNVCSAPRPFPTVAPPPPPLLPRRTLPSSASSAISETKRAVVLASRKSSFKVDSVGYPRWHNVVSGAAAGAGARILTAPLDLVRIRRQLSSSFSSSLSSPLGAPLPSSVSASAPAPHHHGGWNLFSSMAHIARTEGGIRSLFRGNVAATYLWITYAAVQFSIYARASDALRGFSPHPPPTHLTTPAASPAVSVQRRPSGRWNAAAAEAEMMTRTTTTTSGLHGNDIKSVARMALERIASTNAGIAFAAGAAAGVGATLVTYPFDITRTAFASRGLLTTTTTTSATGAAAAAAASALPPPKTIAEFVRRMHSSRGLRGFYAGSGPAVVQIVPYMGLNFALHDHLVHLSDNNNINNNKKKRGSAGGSGLAGAIAGGTSKFLVYPMDTVKKRLQAQEFASLVALSPSPSGLGARRYDGMVDCIRTMAREEGVAAFYRGLVPTVIKSMAATGLTFAFFTMSKNALERIHDKIMSSDVQ